MPQITLDDVSIGFRGPPLLDGVSANIDAGDRIGLLGRNGAGKTTLLRMLDGIVVTDGGSVQITPGVQITRLTQDVPQGLSGTIHQVVLEGQAVDDDPGTQWQVEHAVDQTLSRMQLDPAAEVSDLSSGMKRRVLLARAIAGNPDVLLLDEPTNHLDIESILWLEKFLRQWRNTLIFITHDRSFLQNLASRIWEIDRGKLFDWTCDYNTFLKRKSAAIEAEEKQAALFDKKLAQEEVWIRQGIKARRTRNEGRVRALKKMRDQRQLRRTGEGKAKLNLQDAQRSGALVAEAKEISFSYEGKPLLENYSITVMRGDKIGIMGPNGSGKTTLLKLLLGELSPTSGNIRLGTNVNVAYFDQLRDTLDPDKTVAENVGEGSDRIQVGEVTKHIYGYLQDYLFAPERARTQVKYLSGGERNRALLAKLMTKPANVIVLDEPTNDLDSETLELLEEQLVDFPGTLLMVSHDRTFLNNVVTSTIVFEEDGVNEYVGGYDDWQAAISRRTETKTAKKDTRTAAKASSAQSPASKKKKQLSYNEQRELKGLPQKIEKLESEIASLHEQMSDPSYFQKPPKKVTQTANKLKHIEEELATVFERWETLEEIQ